MRGNHCPPEYAGTKLAATRTTRDIFTTRDEIDVYIKSKVEEALKKEKVKRAYVAALCAKLILFYAASMTAALMLGKYLN